MTPGCYPTRHPAFGFAVRHWTLAGRRLPPPAFPPDPIRNILSVARLLPDSRGDARRVPAAPGRSECSTWMTKSCGAFPRRVRIEPGDRQVVRLLATPPADLPDGEYWTRLIVSSHGAAIPLATGDTAVRAGVTLEIRIVTSVIYRKGELGTEIIPLTHDPHSYAVSANIMQSRGIAWYRAV